MHRFALFNERQAVLQPGDLAATAGFGIAELRAASRAETCATSDKLPAVYGV
jgi:hypothetical protein